VVGGASLRIGLWLDAPDFPLDPQVRVVLETFAGELAVAGAVVEPISAPVEARSLLDTYLLLLSSTIAEDLPEADRRRFELLRGPAKLARAWGAGPFSWAVTTLGYTARHREWLAADAVRARLRREAAEVFARFDVILAPATPVAAFAHDTRPFGLRRLTASNGVASPYLAMTAWIAMATALGLPATAVPAGQTSGGLPVGAQIIGPFGGDARTIAVAQAIDENIRGFTPPPELG